MAYEGWRGEWHRVQPAVTSAAALIAAFVVAWLMVSVQATGPGGVAYQDLLEHRIWAVLAGISTVVWILAALRTGDIPLALLRGRSTSVPLRRKAQRALLVLALYLLLAIAVRVATSDLTWIDLQPPLANEMAWRPRALMYPALAASCPVVVGMWSIYARLRELSLAIMGEGERVTAGEFLAELRSTWADSRRCLIGGSAVVATAVVLTGALRNTLVAAGYPAETLPASSVVLYGAFFTVLGLIIYVPLYLAWRRRVSDFLDRLYPYPEDGLVDEEWVAGRARLMTFLDADTTFGKSLTTVAGILTPLAASAISIFIPS